MALDPMDTKHSLANAIAMAECSQLAYQDAPIIKSGIAKIIGGNRSLKEFKFISNRRTNTEVFMAGFEDAIILCFRGTAGVSDIAQDGQIALVPFRNLGLIHFGFRNAFDSVYAEIEATLEQWSGMGRTLWITGHSLGGALALLAAAHLRFPADPTKTLPRPIAGLYTFGQPRVGTANFCQACDANFGSYYFRYVNNEDIVTRIPPRELGYWHAGKTRYIDKDGKIHDDPAWWQVFLDRVAAGLEALRELQAKQPKIGLIHDHGIVHYIAAIRKILGI